MWQKIQLATSFHCCSSRLKNVNLWPLVVYCLEQCDSADSNLPRLCLSWRLKTSESTCWSIGCARLMTESCFPSFSCVVIVTYVLASRIVTPMNNTSCTQAQLHQHQHHHLSLLSSSTSSSSSSLSSSINIIYYANSSKDTHRIGPTLNKFRP